MIGRTNAAWSNKSCHVGISHVIRAKNPRKEDVVGIVISMNNDNMAMVAPCRALSTRRHTACTDN